MVDKYRSEGLLRKTDGGDMRRPEKSTPSVRGTTREIEQMARQLRKKMTRAELILWKHLRRKQLDGLKFRAQHPLGRFIVDFYCASSRLIVELDGDIHDQQIERDKERTGHFITYGYRVIRFRNEDVFENIEGVLATIRQSCKE